VTSSPAASRRRRDGVGAQRRALASTVGLALTFALALALPATWAARADAAAWVHLYTKDGVRVESRDVPGRDLPELRGVGVLPFNLYEILAVIDDVPNQRHWVERLERSAVLRRPSPWELWMYVRFDFPWPTSDRDSVLHVNVSRTLAPQHEVVLRTERSTDPARPVVDGIVRVPRSVAEARLRFIDADHTHVTYLVDIDPGGSLPHWLVRMLQEDMPLKILRRLKARIHKTRGRYDGFLARWDPSRAGASAPPVSPTPVSPTPSVSPPPSAP
jgi:hypothetical protein